MREATAVTFATLLGVILPACSPDRLAPGVTCGDLQGGKANACQDGIIASCQVGASVMYEICPDPNVCSEPWQKPGAYVCLQGSDSGAAPTGSESGSSSGGDPRARPWVSNATVVCPAVPVFDAEAQVRRAVPYRHAPATATAALTGHRSPASRGDAARVGRVRRAARSFRAAKGRAARACVSKGRVAGP